MGGVSPTPADVIPGLASALCAVLRPGTQKGGADVFDYIERFYNLRRRHSALGYISAADHETKMRLA